MITGSSTARRRLLPAGASWRNAVIGGAAIWLAARLLVTVVSLLAVGLHRGAVTTDPLGTRTPGVGGFFGLLFHWDSAYFLQVAQHGYFSAGAFAGLPSMFPGYPLLARVLAAPFGGGRTPLLVGMWTVSLLASLAAGILLWRLVATTLRPDLAPWVVLLFLAGPYAVFLSADYSESLFCAFAIGAWYGATRNRWWAAGVCAGLASFTRINGVFLILALLVWYLLQRRRSLRADALWVLPAVAGIAAYFGYLAARTGDLLAWETAERVGWGRQFSPPWQAFYQTAGRVLYAATIDRRFQFALDIVAAAGILVALVVLLRRRRWPESVYVGLTLLALTTSFTFVSLARASLTLFPVTILLASVLRGRTKVVVVCLWVVLFLGNTVSFALGYWTD